LSSGTLPDPDAQRPPAAEGPLIPLGLTLVRPTAGGVESVALLLAMAGLRLERPTSSLTDLIRQSMRGFRSLRFAAFFDSLFVGLPKAPERVRLYASPQVQAPASLERMSPSPTSQSTDRVEF
jgi:hypothetical protein